MYIIHVYVCTWGKCEFYTFVNRILTACFRFLFAVLHAATTSAVVLLSVGALPPQTISTPFHISHFIYFSFVYLMFFLSISEQTFLFTTILELSLYFLTRVMKKICKFFHFICLHRLITIRLRLQYFIVLAVRFLISSIRKLCTNTNDGYFLEKEYNDFGYLPGKYLWLNQKKEGKKFSTKKL